MEGYSALHNSTPLDVNPSQFQDSQGHSKSPNNTSRAPETHELLDREAERDRATDSDRFTTFTTKLANETTTTSNTRGHRASNGSLFDGKPARSVRRWWSSRTYLRTWWWETVCCVVALGALLAIIGTIHTHNQKESPKWQFGLTVNAMLAVYTTILKAAAGLVVAQGLSHLKWNTVARPNGLSMFVAQDEASRGPLGAMTLLWKSLWSKRWSANYRSSGFRIPTIISSLGALITICILLLDPFSQQIIQTFYCEKELTSENATIARTNVYYPDGFDEFILSADFRRVVYDGIFAVEKQPVPFTCRTGNCTFADPYVSLGYCSSCADVTAQLETEVYAFGTNRTDNQTIWNTNVTLPGFLRSAVDGNLTLSRRAVRATEGFVRLTSYYDDNDSELGIIRWDGDSPTVNENQTILGYRCQIYRCMKEFKANVSRGELSEVITKESTNMFDDESLQTTDLWPISRSSIADLQCIDEQDRMVLQALGHQINQTTRWIPYDIFLSFGSPVWNETEGTMKDPIYILGRKNYTCPSEEAAAYNQPKLCKNGNRTEESLKIVPARCIYNIGYWDDYTLRYKLLRRFFLGEVWDPPSHPETPDLSPSTDALYALYGAGTGSGTLEDLEGFLAGLTDALTSNIRRTGNENFSLPATGIMTEYTTCIEVKWAWLAFAGTVVSLLLIFFVWMIAHACATQTYLQKRWGEQETTPLIHDFKSSALTMLFHGLDRQSLQALDRQDIGASNRERVLRRETKDVQVNLVATERGWKLSAAD